MSLVIARKPGEVVILLLDGMEVGRIRILPDSTKGRIRLALDLDSNIRAVRAETLEEEENGEDL
jgi:hypothetical protein